MPKFHVKPTSKFRVRLPDTGAAGSCPSQALSSGRAAANEHAADEVEADEEDEADEADEKTEETGEVALASTPQSCGSSKRIWTPSRARAAPWPVTRELMRSWLQRPIATLQPRG